MTTTLTKLNGSINLVKLIVILATKLVIIVWLIRGLDARISLNQHHLHYMQNELKEIKQDVKTIIKENKWVGRSKWE